MMYTAGDEQDTRLSGCSHDRCDLDGGGQEEEVEVDHAYSVGGHATVSFGVETIEEPIRRTREGE
jgi:hypothetical protein